MSQVKSGDKGFLSKHITVQALIEDRGDIHHLFPKKYLQKNGLNIRGEYNQIANYVYTQSEINNKIKDEAPCDYMKKILKQIETKEPIIGGIVNMDELNETLKQNCIPKEFINYSIENYKLFLEKRRILMYKKIKEYYFNL